MADYKRPRRSSSREFKHPYSGRENDRGYRGRDGRPEHNKRDRHYRDYARNSDHNEDRRGRHDYSDERRRDRGYRGNRENRPHSDESRSRSPSPIQEPEQPSYTPSGALNADRAIKADQHPNAAALSYVEPAESRKPEKDNIRLYVFKAGEIIDTFTLSPQPVYLLGRDRAIADIPLDHPSCSKQHAVIQFKLVKVERQLDPLHHPTSDPVLPFIYDLGSSNGTLVNGDKLPPKTFIQLKHKDMIQFGLSSREFLLLDTDEEP
ncbi:SMAD/FHA domain-containing protein [Dipodascopsis uninucleata]